MKLINFLRNESLSRHTSWKVGGPADVFFIPDNRQDLSQFLSQNKGNSVTWLGNGTNVLVRDGGIRGVVISTKKSNSSIFYFSDDLDSFSFDLEVVRLQQNQALLRRFPWLFESHG